MENGALKDMIEKLGVSKKLRKDVDTRELKVKDNTIYYSWDENNETALQISNISRIDIGPAPTEKIPGLFIVMVIIGFGMSFLHHVVLGFILMIIATACIYFIEQGNKHAGDNLIIHLNNGNYFIFNFKNKAFLKRVFNLLLDCINHKTVGETIINISNSTIQSSNIGIKNQMEAVK